MKDFVVKLVLAAQGVAEENSDCMNSHEVLLEHLFDGGFEYVFEGVVVKVLESDICN